MSYKLAGVTWDDMGTMETKKLSALEALETIKHTTDLYTPNELNGYKQELDVIETALKELEECREMMRRFNKACGLMTLDNETEKKLKAFEIIKKSMINTNDNKYYNVFGFFIDIRKLAPEEYDLLKEVLK